MRIGLIEANHIVMKKTYYLLLFGLILNACNYPQQYHQRINYIPTQGPNFGVEILFQEQLPEKPYFEVIEFNIAENGNLSKEEIIKKLEMEAIKEGVDAVINVKYSKRYEVETNFFTFLIDALDDEEGTTTIESPVTDIQAVGIKYLENIDYIQEQPEFEYVYQIDEKTNLPEPAFKIEYNLAGQEHMVYPESEEGKDIYENYFKPYSDFHLISQREQWYHKTKNTQLIKRILRDENGNTVKTCFFEYDEQGRIKKIRIRNRLKGYDTVDYHYGVNGKKHSKMVTIHNNTTVFEQYDYEGDQLVGRQMKINVPNKKNYSLNTSIVYYNPDFLKDYYEQENTETKPSPTSE